MTADFAIHEPIERRWALTLLSQTLTKMRDEYEQTARVSEFELLKEYLTAARGTIPYPAIAATLGLGEGGARTALHRMRRRFREIFPAAVAATVTSPACSD